MRRHISSATYLADLHLLTLNGQIEGYGHWATLRPPGPPPSPRAAASAVASVDGGFMLFGGHDASGMVAEPALELIALSGGAIRHASAHAGAHGESIAEEWERLSPTARVLAAVKDAARWAPRHQLGEDEVRDSHRTHQPWPTCDPHTHQPPALGDPHAHPPWSLS